MNEVLQLLRENGTHAEANPGCNCGIPGDYNCVEGTLHHAGCPVDDLRKLIDELEADGATVRELGMIVAGVVTTVYEDALREIPRIASDTLRDALETLGVVVSFPVPPDAPRAG